MAANPESLTPDAALLEARPAINPDCQGCCQGSQWADEVVEALRAALDRERWWAGECKKAWGERERLGITLTASLDREREMWDTTRQWIAANAPGGWIDDLRRERDALREALEIIAGRRQCIDNLMSDRDVAESALAAELQRLKEGHS